MRFIVFDMAYITVAEGYALIDGRVCEDNVRVGDVFTEVRGHDKRWDGKTGEWISLDPGPVITVNLTIETIQWYGTSRTELLPGDTARLRVTGSDIEKLKESCLLVGLCEDKTN